MHHPLSRGNSKSKTMNPTTRDTPLTNAVNSGEWGSLEIRYDLMHDLAEMLETQRDELQAKLDSSEKELAEIKAILSDANAVRINMLRGAIAYTKETLLHVLGDDAQILEMNGDSLQAKLDLAVEALEKFRGQFDNLGCTGTAEDTLDAIKAGKEGA
jgi:hypothetical protein